MITDGILKKEGMLEGSFSDNEVDSNLRDSWNNNF